MVTQLTKPLGILLLVAGCSGTAGKLPNIRPGIEVLLQDSIHLVSGADVAILTNRTGIDSKGRSDIDLLLDAGVTLRAIFSPEHAFMANLDVEGIDHSLDSATGLPIYSLYGDTRAPTPAMLAGIDVLLVDLPDIGARTYTYTTTAVLATRSAAENGVTIVVLDRPNPIGGVIQGPVLQSEYSSFVGMLDLPLRHGMTMGEMTAYANESLGIGADLRVVPVDNWRRSMWFDQLDLPWVRPSPNMPDLESATHYPGLVLFEATNLSVGRGTEMAFQLLGAPWLDARAVIAHLGGVEGVALSDTVFVPRAPGDGKYDGATVRGIRLQVTDRGNHDPTELAVRLFDAVSTLHPEFSIQNSRLDARYGSDSLRVLLAEAGGWQRIVSSWPEGLRDFSRRVSPYLIYPE